MKRFLGTFQGWAEMQPQVPPIWKEACSSRDTAHGKTSDFNIKPPDEKKHTDK